MQRSDWRARVKGDRQLDRFAAVGAIKSLGLRHDGTSQRPLFLLAVRDTAWLKKETGNLDADGPLPYAGDVGLVPIGDGAGRQA